ncbi:hypothetical protein CN918_25710 [Priestia megaterium]|nr:hypothetical protein CN918_25710 [Priestia megaterium]
MNQNTLNPNELVNTLKRTHKKLTKGKILLRGLFILIGAFLMAVALEIFLIPNTIMDGGIMGISIILSHLTHWNLGIFIFILNIPFLFIGYKHIGKTFTISTLFGITVLSISTALLHHVDAFTNDMLLVTFFGGIILGVGVGIVIRYGGCLDGAEVLAILASKRLPVSVGQSVMFINVIVFGIGGFVFGWDRGLYSILAFFIAFKTMDVVIDGLEESKSAWIISENSEELGQAMLARLGRGVTYFHGEGAYTGDRKKVIFCVITRLEEAKLKDIVDSVDPNAFVAVADISEVRGGRFKKKAIH